MRLSIKVAVLGSRPELSVTKRYLGLFTIALAIATLFCIPPEISDEVCYEHQLANSCLAQSQLVL
jgi:hypothetical protein